MDVERLLTPPFSQAAEARTGQQLAANRRWRIDTALASIIRERGFQSVDQLVSRLVSEGMPPCPSR